MRWLQPVIAQLVEVLRSCELPARSKLQCAAAALEQNPDALATSLPDQATETTLSLIDPCCHAALQSLSQQAFQEGKPADSPPETFTEAGELVTGVSGRIALAVQSWSQNKLTQTAASQMHALYHQHWEQQQQQQSGNERVDASAGSEQALEAGTLWPMAEAALLTQLRKLGMVTSEMDDSSVQPLWHDMQTALDMAVVHIGWEWAYYAVSSFALTFVGICTRHIFCLFVFNIQGPPLSSVTHVTHDCLLQLCALLLLAMHL